MFKSQYLTLWFGLLSLINYSQDQKKSSEQLWDSYFESIQTQPAKALQVLEEPLIEARTFALQQKDTSQFMEMTVLLMLIYNNQSKFAQTYQIYTEIQQEKPEQLEKDPFLHKAFQYLGYHSNSRVNRKQDLPFLRTIAGTFGDSTAQERLFQALSLDLLGRTLYDNNRYQESIETLSKANAIIQKENLRGLLGASYTMLGIVSDAKEEYHQAIEYYKRSNQALESLKTPPYGTMAVNAYNIGLIYRDRFSEALKSLPYYEKALEYDRLDGGDENPYLADDFRSLSIVYFRMYDYERSELYLKRAIEHYIAHTYPENPSLATAYLNAAQLESQKKQYDVALSYVEKAIQIYELNKQKNNTDIRRWLANAYNSRGNIALQMGDIDAAIEAYQTTEKISIDLDRTIYLMEAYRGLIRAQIEKKRPDQAFTTYLKWDKIIEEKLKDAPRFVAERRLTLAEIQFEMDETNALDDLSQLINDLGTQSGMSDLYLRSLHLRTKQILRSYESMQENDIISHLNQYHLALINEYNGKNGPFNKELFNTLMKPAIIDLVQLCYESNQARPNSKYIEMAFRFMDINKSTSLMEGLNVYKDQIAADIPLEIRDEENKLMAIRNASLVKIQTLQQQHNEDTTPLLEAYSTYEQQNDRLDSLHAVLKDRYPSYMALSQLDSNASISDVLVDMESDQTLVSYLLAAPKGFVLVITKETQTLHDLMDVPSLVKDLHQHRLDIIQRNFPKADSLFQRLLPFPRDSLTNLVIIPDGALNGLPFETLPYRGKALIHQAQVSYRTGFRHPIVSNQQGWKWIGFAPHYSERSLPYNQAEVKRVSKIAGGRYFMASKATKESFLRHSPKATVIHLAAHGFINQTNPMASSILFGDDPSQKLSTLEIYGLQLKGTLAVLSACNTGWNNAEMGDGWLSLSRAFAFAGVQSTLMSLWEVPDRETAIIMEAFYKYLRAGLPKDEALQKAKVEYLAQTTDPALQHPYYWAGFVLSGDMTAFDPPPPIWIWFLPLIVVLVLVYLHQFELSRKKVQS